MHVISRRALSEFGIAHPNAKASLRGWFKIASNAEWKNIAEVRADLPGADAVPLEGRKTATIFNIGGNRYRLAAAVHYDIGRVFVRRVMTHAEYDKDKWRNDF